MWKRIKKGVMGRFEERGRNQWYNYVRISKKIILILKTLCCLSDLIIQKN